MKIEYTKEAYEAAFARARFAMLNPLVREQVEAALARTGQAIARLRETR
jgi:hypothetical protein